MTLLVFCCYLSLIVFLHTFHDPSRVCLKLESAGLNMVVSTSSLGGGRGFSLDGSFIEDIFLPDYLSDTISCLSDVGILERVCSAYLDYLNTREELLWFLVFFQNFWLHPMFPLRFDMPLLCAAFHKPNYKILD